MLIEKIAPQRRKSLSEKVPALAIAAMLLAAGLPATAQDATPADAAAGGASDIDALRAQIKALQDRLDAIEASQKKTAAASAKAPAATSKFPIVVSGLGQVHYLGFQGQDRTIQRTPDTFRLRRAEMAITATITPRITGLLRIDAAKALAQNTQGIINQGSNILQDIKITYLLNKAKNGNEHLIDVGQYKIPIGYEGDLTPSSSTQMVERALIFTQRDPFGGGFGDVRDTGAQARGTIGQFDYNLGFFNGLGERQNALATSDNKAVIGRLIFKPRSINGLQLGISGANAAQGNTPNPGVRSSRSIFNLLAAYKNKKLTAQAEYLTGDSSVNPAAITGVRDIGGYYAHIGYLFNPKLEGALRYDSFDFDRNLGDTTVRDITLGVNYYIRGNNAKIQANIVRRLGAAGINGANGFASGTANNFREDRTELRTNFQIGF